MSKIPHNVKEYITNNHVGKKNNIISKEIYEKFNFNMTPRQIACFKYRNNLKSGLYIGQVKRVCLNCGKKFEITNALVKFGHGKFCNPRCQNDYKIKQTIKRNNKIVSNKDIRLFILKYGPYIERNCYSLDFNNKDELYGFFVRQIPSILYHIKTKKIPEIRHIKYIYKSLYRCFLGTKREKKVNPFYDTVEDKIVYKEDE